MSHSEFDDFLSRLKKESGIHSQQELAGLIGVNRSAVTQAKNRDHVPEKWILKLSRQYGYNPDWLENGTGAPFLRTTAEPETEFKKVPKVRARLCAGGGSFETEAAVEDYYAFRLPWLTRKGNPDQMVIMDIFGNSMEPEIREGDSALIDQSQKEIIAGRIYAVGVEDTVMVKRIEKRPNTLVLISDNTDYDPILLRGDEIESVRIIGKLVWICRELR